MILTCIGVKASDASLAMPFCTGFEKPFCIGFCRRSEHEMLCLVLPLQITPEECEFCCFPEYRWFDELTGSFLITSYRRNK